MSAPSTSATPTTGSPACRIWMASAPAISRIARRRISAFLANQIDLALLSGADVQDYISQQGPGFTPIWGAGRHDWRLHVSECEGQADGRCPRHARLRLLIDHDEFITPGQNQRSGAATIGSLFPIALSDWDLTQDEYRKQLEWKQPKDDAAKEALSLLSAAGYTKDKPLKFTLIANAGSQGGLSTQLMQAQWKRLSQGVVDVDIKLLAQAEIDTARANRSFAYRSLRPLSRAG